MFDEEPDAPLHGECAAEIRRLTAELSRSLGAAENWRALCKLAGHWQDDSAQTVALIQDDSTRECGVRVGDRPVYSYHRARRTYWASNFESALERAVSGEAA